MAIFFLDVDLIFLYREIQQISVAFVHTSLPHPVCVFWNLHWPDMAMTSSNTPNGKIILIQHKITEIDDAKNNENVISFQFSRISNLIC